MQPRRKTTSVDATYDGEVVRTDKLLPLPPNARVTVSYEVADEEQRPAETKKKSTPYAVLKAALAANIEGPPDWSQRVTEGNFLAPDADKPS
jgi:hypothetical protein